MKEQLLSINDFNIPKSLEGIEADIIMIIRLVMLDPGTFQSHPNMGVGLVSKWRYSSAEDLSNLEDEIQKQISVYLPHLVTTSVAVRYQGRCIVMDIATSSYTMQFKTDEEITILYLKDILA